MLCTHADLSPREVAAERNFSVMYLEDHRATSRVMVAFLGLRTSQMQMAAARRGYGTVHV